MSAQSGTRRSSRLQKTVIKEEVSGVDVQQIPAVTQQTTGEGQAQENGNADSEVIMAELVDVIEEQQNDETVVMNEPESQNLDQNFPEDGLEADNNDDEDEVDTLTDIDELGDFEEELMMESSRPLAANSNSSSFASTSQRPPLRMLITVGHDQKTDSAKNIYECDECGKTFPSPSKLSAHKISHTGLKQHQCYVCLKAFAYKSDLNRHLRNIHQIGTGNDDYGRINPDEEDEEGEEGEVFYVGSNGQTRLRRRLQCEACGKKFSTLAKLKYHCQFHVGLTCAVCNKVFTLKSSLRRHSLRHQEEIKTNKCSVCQCEFTRREKLLEHQRKMHNFYNNDWNDADSNDGQLSHPVNGYQCDQCDEVFETAYRLSLHVVSHTGFEKRESYYGSSQMGVHQCKTCGLVFQTDTILDRHVLKSKQCLIGNLISEIPTDSSNDTSNQGQTNGFAPQQTDANKQPFQGYQVAGNGPESLGSDDNSGGSEYESLATNYQKRSKGFVKGQNYKRMYQCDQCGRVFPSAALLTAHRSAHTRASTEHQCPVCYMVFTAETTYIEHMEVEHQLSIAPAPMNTTTISASTAKENHAAPKVNFGVDDNDEATRSAYDDDDDNEDIPEEDPFDVQSNVFVPLPPLPLATSRNYKSSTLDAHQSNSTNGDSKNKPYKCAQCGKLFSSPSKLKAHQVTHSGQKRHQCRICEKYFGYKSDVRRHLRNVHQITNNIDNYSRAHDVIPSPNYSRSTLTPASTSSVALKEEAEEGEVFIIQNNQQQIQTFPQTQRPIIRIKLVPKPHAQPQQQRSQQQPPQQAQQSQQRKTSGPKRHECDVCGKVFPCLSKLTDHQLTHSGIKDHACPVCGRAFAKKSNLTVHLRIHDGFKDKPYQCTICNECFRGKSALDEHRRQMHSAANRYLCPTCGRVFGRKGQLEDHMISHNDAKPYQCPFCENGYKRYRHLKDHLKAHAIEDEHLEVDGDASLALTENTSDDDDDMMDCDDISEATMDVDYESNNSNQLSNQLFTSSPGMLQQLDASNAVENVEYVDDVYASTEYQPLSPTMLQPSTSSATPTLAVATAKPSPVAVQLQPQPIAAKYIVLSTTLIKKTPPPAVANKCPLCPKSFPQQESLNVHLRLTHSGRQAKFPCTDCDEIFTYKDGIIRHRRLVHGDVNAESVYQCEDCLMKFSTKDYLRRHRQIHEEVNNSSLLKCPDCPKTFALARYLRYHQQLIHSTDRQYQCPHCDKAFTRPKDLRVHSIVHSEERPFKCPFCPQAFKRQREMKRHSMRSHEEY